MATGRAKKLVRQLLRRDAALSERSAEPENKLDAPRSLGIPPYATLDEQIRAEVLRLEQGVQNLLAQAAQGNVPDAATLDRLAAELASQIWALSVRFLRYFNLVEEESDRPRRLTQVSTETDAVVAHPDTSALESAEDKSNRQWQDAREFQDEREFFAAVFGNPPSALPKEDESDRPRLSEQDLRELEEYVRQDIRQGLANAFAHPEKSALTYSLHLGMFGLGADLAVELARQKPAPWNWSDLLTLEHDILTRAVEERYGLHFDVVIPPELVPGEGYVSATRLVESGLTSYSESHLSLLMQRGMIPAYRVGRAILLDQACISTLLDYEEGKRASLEGSGRRPGPRPKIYDLLPPDSMMMPDPDIEVPRDIVPGGRYITVSALVASGATRYSKAQVFKLAKGGVINLYRIGHTALLDAENVAVLIEYEQHRLTSPQPGRGRKPGSQPRSKRPPEASRDLG